MPDETQQPTSEPTQPEPISTPSVENQNSEPNPVPVSPDEPKDEASSSHGASEPAPVPEPQMGQNPAPETPQNPPETAPQPPTAQMAGNEPLAPVSAISSDEAKQKRKENLERANAKRQEKKRDKINEILNLFAERQKITNDEVEKLLHVSDATATRYLETLENEGKIKQVGKTGKGVVYEKI